MFGSVPVSTNVFPAKRLESDADIDAYVEKMREQLKTLMKNCDGIELK